MPKESLSLSVMMWLVDFLTFSPYIESGPFCLSKSWFIVTELEKQFVSPVLCQCFSVLSCGLCPGADWMNRDVRKASQGEGLCEICEDYREIFLQLSQPSVPKKCIPYTGLLYKGWIAVSKPSLETFPLPNLYSTTVLPA